MTDESDSAPMRRPASNQGESELEAAERRYPDEMHALRTMAAVLNDLSGDVLRQVSELRRRATAGD